MYSKPSPASTLTRSALSERRQEAELFVSGHELLGLTLLRVGDLIECRSHMELAVRRYGDGRDRALRDSLGRDPAVSCLGFGALALWLLGYPDQAVAGAAQAVRAAHATVVMALDLASDIGPYWWEAELFRVKGALLLANSIENAGEAQSCFERALAVARKQSAKSLELRACVSMARLARRQGRHARAVVELDAVYKWFTEGFDTVDLVEARELLRELG